MSQVIYRKYRSKDFSEIIGQDHIVSVLVESVLTSNISHGYLFCGPRGTGKTSIARLLAKAVNCDNFAKNKDVCNECIYCKMINDGETMDIIEMDAASNRGIEEIRNMRDTISYMPSTLKKKVYIIDEAHMLTKEAFNALLKTLEEPPDHVIFILATTEPHKLPITILSRVQRYDLSLASEKDLTQKITTIISQEEREIDNKSLEIIYRKSGGSFRDAESILGKILSATSKKKITEKDLYESLGIIEEDYIEDFLNALLEHNAAKAIELLNMMHEKSGSVNNIIDQSLEQIREKIIKNLDKLDKNIYSLANLFINLKINLRDFNEKMTLVEIELINYCNISQPFYAKSQEVAESKTETTKNAGQKESEKIQEKQAGAVEIISTESHAESFKDLDELMKHIIIDSKGKYPRLKSILESSKIKIEDQSIVIANRHKFNIIYLERKDVKEYLQEKVAKLNLTKVAIVVLAGEEDEVIVVDKSSEKVIQNIQKEMPVEAKVEKIESSQKDNTSLVEGLL